MNTLLVTPSARHEVLAALQGLIRARPCFQSMEVMTFDQLAATRRDTWPMAAFVVTDDDHSDATLAALRQLREDGVKYLLAVGPASDPKLILRAIQSGADLFLDQTDLELELELALSRCRIQRSGTDRAKQCIAVLSAAGGCGASTLAVNLAVLLAKSYGRCNLIDLNAGKADLGPLLDLKPQYTLADLCQNDGRLDASLYEKLLARHESGVALLAAPSELEGAEVTPRGVSRAITLARESHADVVIDLHDCRRDEQWVALEQATRILLTCRPDFTSVRSARRLLDYLTARGVPSDRIDVVMNQSGIPNEILAADAEVALGRPIKLFVPHDPDAMTAANNTGVPVALTNRHAAVSQAIAKVVGLEDQLTRSPSRFVRVATDASGQMVCSLRSLFRRLTKPKEEAQPVTPPADWATPMPRRHLALTPELYAVDHH